MLKSMSQKLNWLKGQSSRRRSLQMGAAFVFVLAAGFMLGSGHEAQSKPLEIRISWSVTPQHMTPLIPKIPMEVYRHYGKSYVVKPVRLRGSGATHTALAAKEIDIAGFNFVSFAKGILNAKQDLKVISQVLSNKEPGDNPGFWVRKDSGINSVKDLKGKTVAINAFGGTIEAAANVVLGGQGLKSGSDFKVVEVRFPAMLPALETKQVDASYLVLPFSLIAKRKKNFKLLFTMRQALGRVENVIWAVRGQFLKENRAALVDFMEDHIRMRRWVHDSKNRDKILGIISKATKRPAKNYASWVFTERDSFRSMNAKFDPKSLQKNINDMHRLGFLKNTLDLKKHMDLSIADDAMKRIK